MKTIYLKAATKELLVADIAKAVTISNIEGSHPYAGEIEFSCGDIEGHWIGDIMLTPDVLNAKREVVTPATFVGAFHANLFVPEDFDSSVFKTLVVAPNNPKHQFA